MIDRHVILAVIYVIGGNLMILVAGIVFSAFTGRQIDAGVSALAGSALGYLGGILTNVRKAEETPQPPYYAPEQKQTQL